MKTERAVVWQDRVLSVAGYAVLAAVELCVAAMSWTGLTGFASASLHLSGVRALMVPVSLDGAAAAAAFLALRSVARGDSAAGSRLMVLAFTGASAFLNWHHAVASYTDPTAALFFGGMSIAVLAMFELILRELRRHALLTIGAVEAPIARFRLLRWLRFPAETWAAWSVALRHGYRTPAEALARVWDSHETRVELARVEALDSLEGMTKADAARAALTATSGDVRAAIGWLDEHGVEMDRSYVYDVARRLREAQAKAERLAVAS